ncbi:hypothetical protein SH584_09405 [Sphingomonas sp. LY29]|uniref:hypothetical protein n=1 Tax=Sphingomonas sp. LY29 TaxID=3095341 RepID=UPI002D788F1F|nr:hypothetical protein [Sphingomonas sp. LY29]WRP25261.1 hypothetical protein SH584_09405 [Sphingomonas sp. LY29]
MIEVKQWQGTQEDAVDLMERLVELLDDYRSRDDAFRISLCLAKLHGVLRMHWLRPASRRHGGLVSDVAIAFEQFANRWTSSAVIAASIADFRRDALAMCAMLFDRFRSEQAAALVATAQQARWQATAGRRG